MAGNLRRGLLAPSGDVSGHGDDDLLGNGKWSRADVLRYGGLVQAAYDAFNAGTIAAGCVGSRLLPGGALTGTGYVATAALYSTVDIIPGKAFDDRRHWIGYVAVAAELDAAGYREIVVVWRGTLLWWELVKDFEFLPVQIDGGARRRSSPLPTVRRQVHDELRRWPTPLSLRAALAVQTAWDATKARVAAWLRRLRASLGGAGEDQHGKQRRRRRDDEAELRARRRADDELRRVGTRLSLGRAPGMLTAWAAGEAWVADGFYSLYTAGGDTCTDAMASAQSQVLGELGRLVGHFREKHHEKIRVTVTGHSLGGALSLLTARDAAGDDELSAAGGGGVPIRVVTFGCPLVGNRAFRDELLRSPGVSVLRVAMDKDPVTKVPPEFMGYVHAGEELPVRSLGLRDIVGFFHLLYIYVRLLGGDDSDAGAFRWDMGYRGCETPAPAPAPEPSKDQSKLVLPKTKLDEMIYSEKKTKSLKLV